MLSKTGLVMTSVDITVVSDEAVSENRLTLFKVTVNC